MLVCLSVRLNPINVKTAEPIRRKFVVAPRLNPRKGLWMNKFSKICLHQNSIFEEKKIIKSAKFFVFVNTENLHVISSKYNRTGSSLKLYIVLVSYSLYSYQYKDVLSISRLNWVNWYHVSLFWEMSREESYQGCNQTSRIMTRWILHGIVLIFWRVVLPEIVA